MSDGNELVSLTGENADAGAGAAIGQQDRSIDEGLQSLEALSLFLTGLATIGGGELLQRLLAVQRELEAAPAPQEGDAYPHDATALALLRYLALGSLSRGRRMVFDGVRRGFSVSVGTTRWALGGLDRLTNNRLMRPLRQPLASRLRRMGQTAAAIAGEGRLEEENAQSLAIEALGDIVEEVFGYLAESPELVDLIRSQVGAQSAGLANVVVDNTRQVSVTADYFTEGVLRRVLRRTSRADLPPSPLAGQAQTMYDPDPEAWEADNHDG